MPRSFDEAARDAAETARLSAPMSSPSPVTGRETAQFQQALNGVGARVAGYLREHGPALRPSINGRGFWKLWDLAVIPSGEVRLAKANFRYKGRYTTYSLHRIKATDLSRSGSAIHLKVGYLQLDERGDDQIVDWEPGRGLTVQMYDVPPTTFEEYMGQAAGRGAFSAERYGPSILSIGGF